MRCNACRHVCMSHHFLNLWMFVCPCASIELFDSTTVMKFSRSQINLGPVKNISNKQANEKKGQFLSPHG